MIILVSLLWLLHCSYVFTLDEIDVDGDYLYGKYNWTVDPPCVDPGPVLHATRFPDVNYNTLYPKHSRVHYTCLPNYKLVGESDYIVCAANGKWEPETLPFCRPAVCVPPAIENGYIASIHFEFLPKSNVEVFCHDGYRLQNKFVNKLECQNDGTWTGHNGDFTQEFPECIEATCSPLREVNHASLTYNGTIGGDHGFKEGTVAKFSCHQGFLMSGSSNMSSVRESRCHNGQWTNAAAFECKLVGCKAPPVIPHGNREILLQESGRLSNPSGAAYPVGVLVIYWCNSGYVLRASSLKFRCTPNGSWQPSQIPSCEKLNLDLPDDLSEEAVTCPSPPTILNGFYYDARDRYEPSSSVTYQCQSDYNLVGPSQLSCDDAGFWRPKTRPSCLPRQDIYKCIYPLPSPTVDKEAASSAGESESFSQTIPLVTAVCVSFLLSIILILAVAYQRRKWNLRLNHIQLQPPTNDGSSVNAQLSQYQDQDRVSLIAFADGAHMTLPTYEESMRQRSTLATTNRPSGRYSRFAMHRSFNQDQASGGSNRQASSLHAGCDRSASVADSLDSNDTVTPSEASTTVTVDTLSSNASHTASAASTRAFCGSLASFDTTGSGSILNIEGVPLLEEGDAEAANHQELV